MDQSLPKLEDMVRINVSNYINPSNAVQIYGIALYYTDYNLCMISMSEMVMRTSDIVFGEIFRNARSEVVQNIIRKHHLFVRLLKLEKALYSWARKYLTRNQKDHSDNDINARLDRMGRDD